MFDVYPTQKAVLALSSVMFISSFHVIIISPYLFIKHFSTQSFITAL